MSRRGENIYKRRDKRWEGRFIKGYDLKGKAIYSYVYAKSYREVKEKLADAKLNKTKIKNSEKKNMGEFCNEWLVISRNRVKESTYVKYRTVVYKHIKPYFDALPIERTSTLAIEEFSNGLLRSGLSAKTVKDILTVLRAILKYCKKEAGERIGEVEVIYPKEKKKEMRVLSPDEQKRLIAYLLTDMDNVKFGILLALLTGMRIGEVCALRWRDVSLDERIIRITSTMQRLQALDEEEEAKTRVIVDDAKSEASKRTIPLTDYALALCRRMMGEEDAYILSGEVLRYVEPRALQYRFKRYTEACDLEGVHFHSLRHTFATRCVEVGFEIKSLSEILGHSSSKVTLLRRRKWIFILSSLRSYRICRL